MLIFTSSWEELRDDIKAPLSKHRALHFEDELPLQVIYQMDLLPN